MSEIILTLKFIGLDHLSLPTYRDQYGRLWKDIDLGEKTNPNLYSVTNNDMDGEPCCPINQKYQFEKEPYRENAYSFQYRMLDRLRCDCDYFLGYGDRDPDILWAKDVPKHIGYMKTLWNEVLIKPVWLTWEQIIQYEAEMSKQVERNVWTS